jgi:transposase-like protein
MVAAAIRSIFEQPDEHSASEQLRRVADGLSARFPAVAELLTDAEADLLVHFTFPEAHRRQIRSTNPQERLNKEIPVLDWCAPEGPRRRLLGWVSVPGPDSKEISGATSI